MPLTESEQADERFANRREAGRALAARLAWLAGERPVVLALPRGGVPVGAEIAAALDAPLEILAVRKLATERNPEFGIGALAEDGTCVVDHEAASVLGLGNGELERIVAREGAELTRRVRRLPRRARSRSTSPTAPWSSSTTASPPASPTPRRCARRAAGGRAA